MHLPASELQNHLSINQLKGLQKDIKFQRAQSHCGGFGNDMADYLAKNGTTSSQISACELQFHSVQNKRNIHDDIRYCATESQNKPGKKLFRTEI